MNIIEALKSGKPFRRKSFSSSMDFMDPLDLDLDDDFYKGVYYHFSVADILAEDWETRDVTFSISRNQFWQAVLEAQKSGSGDPETLLYRIAKNLGVE